MRYATPWPRLAIAGFVVATLLAGAAFRVQAQAPAPNNDTGTLPDEMRTLVVGTRFVVPSDGAVSPRAQFTDARVPLSLFNETDHCVDARALEMAQEYFSKLGLLLGKAGFCYVLADVDVDQSLASCERLHGRAPQAFAVGKTKVIAFGQLVPTAAASDLEQRLR